MKRTGLKIPTNFLFKIHEFFRKYLNKEWKFYVAGLLTSIVIISVIFALPLKSINVEEISIKYENIKEIEPVIDREPYYVTEKTTKNSIIADGYYKVMPGGIIIPFNVNYDNCKLYGYYENPIPGRFAILGIGDKVIWEIMGNRGVINIELNKGTYKALFKEDVMWSEDCYIKLQLEWVELVEIIKYREIVKYIENSKLIENYITENVTKRISLWQYLTYR